MLCSHPQVWSSGPLGGPEGQRPDGVGSHGEGPLGEGTRLSSNLLHDTPSISFSLPCVLSLLQFCFQGPLPTTLSALECWAQGLPWGQGAPSQGLGTRSALRKPLLWAPIRQAQPFRGLCCSWRPLPSGPASSLSFHRGRTRSGLLPPLVLHRSCPIGLLLTQTWWAIPSSGSLMLRNRPAGFPTPSPPPCPRQEPCRCGCQ